MRLSTPAAVSLIERTAYPRLRRNPSNSDLSRLYTPTPGELDLARRTTRGGQAQQLAFLVMLKSFQCLGYFPKPEEVPGVVVAHLRSRLGLSEGISAAPPTRSRQRYRDAIRAHLGVKPFGDDARRTAAEAVSGAALTMDEPADLVNVAVEELVQERFELPAFSTLDRLNLGHKPRYTGEPSGWQEARRPGTRPHPSPRCEAVGSVSLEAAAGQKPRYAPQRNTPLIAEESRTEE